MADEVKTAADKAVVEEKAPIAADAEKKADADKGPTVSEVLDPKEKTDEPKMVPESALLEYKKQTKDLQKQVKTLQTQIEAGASKKETNATIAKLKEKYPDSAEFIDEYTSIIKEQMETEIEDRTKSIKEDSNKEKESERRDRVFGEHYEKALDQLPEFKGVAQKEVIKALTLRPENANKTFAKILEEAYGHLIPGKKSIEQKTKPGGGKENAGVDMARAQKDSAYFAEVMADPQLKKEYNAGLEARLKL